MNLDDVQNPLRDTRHYHEYITYLLLKDSYCYPSPLMGEILTKKKVLDGWKKTMRLIRSGKISPKLFIYVHIPFCKCRCLYCMSGSLQLKNGTETISAYLRLLYKEMDDFHPIVGDHEATTLYFGGGTPSLLTAVQTESLFKNIKKRFYLSSRTRIIFEASPFTLNEEKLNILRKYNVHELDLGVQSFDEKVLRRNARPQSASQTIATIRYAKKIGIPSVVVDLMAGMPYQSIDSALKSVIQATQIEVDGIYINPFVPFSWTRFHREGNTYFSGQVYSRNKAVGIIDKLLDKTGYTRTSVGYRRTWTEEDEERAYQQQMVDNLLSFGHGAFSHVSSSLKYQQYICGAEDIYRETLPKIFNSRPPQESLFQYCGFEMDLNREMSFFAFHHLYNFSLAEFKKRFHKDFRQVFKKQLDFLTLNDLAVIEDERIIFSEGDSFMRRFIQAFFIDADYIKKMKRSAGEKYDPGKNYRSLALFFIQEN